MTNSPGFGRLLAGWATVSLDSFYVALAAMTRDSELVRRVRRGDDEWLASFDLSPIERERVQQMARDDGMEVLCSLYRANRLTALLRTVPTLVETLGDGLGEIVTEFWRQTPRVDMQWRTEAVAFCDFIEREYQSRPGLRETCAAERKAVIDYYDAVR